MNPEERQGTQHSPVPERTSQMRKHESITSLLPPVLLLLAVLVICCLLTTHALAAGAAADLTYTVNEDGSITVTGCGGSPSRLNIPDKIDEKDVTAIGERAFSGCTELREIRLPAGLRSIGSYAFADSGLTEAEIPESVTDFGWNPFSGCTALASVSIPAALAGQGFDGCTAVSSVTLTGYGALAPQNQRFGYEYRYTMPWTASGSAGKPVRVTVGDGVTDIGDNAFAGCVGLQEIRLGTGLRNIGVNAFNGCVALTGTLTLPAGLKSIGNGAFFGCGALTGGLFLPDTLELLGDEAFSGCTGLSGALTFPAGLASIGSRVFSGCTGLTGSLVFPAGLESIGDNAFEGCAGLRGTLTFPAELESIGHGAFSGCSGLTGISSFGSSLQTIGDGTFQDCISLGGSTLRFPATLVSIGDYAFFNTAYTNGEMYAIYFPASLTGVGTHAFFGGEDAVRTAYDGWSPADAYANPVPVDYIWCGCSEDEFKSRMSYTPSWQTQFSGTQWDANMRKVYVVKEIISDYGAEPDGIFISGGSQTMQLGTVMKLKATVTPYSASNKTVSWSVSDETVATVSRTGVVTALATGTVTVTATAANGLTDSRTITVVDDLCLIHVYSVDLEGRDRSLAEQLAASYQEAIPLEGAEVTIEGVTRTTDAEGGAVFRASEFPGQGNRVTGEILVSAGDEYFPKSGRVENGLVVSYGPMPELMLDYTNDFYLESKGDDIYILEAKATAGRAHDLLADRNSLNIPALKEDGTENGTLYRMNVRVDWNRYPVGTIRMVGQKSGRQVTLSQGSNYVALGTAFEPLETIEMQIQTLNEEGEQVFYAVPLMLKVIVPLPKMVPPPTEELAVGGETKDGGLYFLEDMKLNFKLDDLAKLAAKASYQDGVLTLEFSGKDSEKQEVDVFRSLKAVIKRPEVTVTGRLQIPLKDNAGSDDLDKGHWEGELEFSWMRGRESKDWQTFAKTPALPKNPNELDRLATLFYHEFHYWNTPVPLYLDLELKAGLKGSVSIHGPFDRQEFSGELGVNGECSIGAGIGGNFTDDLEAKVGVEGKLEASIPVKYDTNESTNGGSLVRFDPSLTGTLTLEVHLKAHKLELDPELELGSFNWDKDGVVWSKAKLQDTDNWHPVGREYLAAGGGFAGDSAVLMDGERRAQPFWENTHACSDAALAVTGDGSLILYATLDDPERGEANALRLAASRYDKESGAWSEPEWIGTDGTLDTMPDADGAFVIWEDSGRAYGPDEGMEAVLLDSGITAAVLTEEGTYAVTRLTEADDACCFGPKIAASGSTAFAAWLANSAADLSGQTGQTDLYGVFFRDGAWSDKMLLASDIRDVSSLNLRYDGETAAVQYKNGTTLTTLSVDGSSTGQENVGRYASADGLLAYFTNRTLHVLEEGVEVCTVETEFSGRENPVAVGGDRPAVFWTEAGGIFYVTRVESGWSGRLCLYGTENTVSGLSVIFAGTEGFEAAWLERSGERTDLITLLASPAEDLALLHAEYDETAYYETGIVTWTAVVFNNGETDAPDGAVLVCDAGGSVVSAVDLPSLAPGQGGTVTGRFAPAADGAFTVRIDAEEDCRLTNNRADLPIGGTDAAIEDAWFLGGTLYIRAANRASAPVGGTLTVRAGGREGPALAQAALDPLARGESRILKLPLQPEAGTTYYLMLDCADDERRGDDLYILGWESAAPRWNSGASGVTAALADGVLTVSAPADEPAISSDSQVLAAVYSGEGRMLEIRRMSFSPAEDGTVSASETLDRLPEDGTVRVFFLDRETAVPQREAITPGA